MGNMLCSAEDEDILIQSRLNHLYVKQSNLIREIDALQQRLYRIQQPHPN